MQIILASASGRRKDLLNQAGIKFDIMASAVDEEAITRLYRDPAELVKALALAKTSKIKRKIEQNFSSRVIPAPYLIRGKTPAGILEKNRFRVKPGMTKRNTAKVPGYLVIAADTVIVFKGKIIGKPRSRAEAMKILHQLSGRQHSVITGIALLDDQNRKKTATDRTAVIFRKLTDRQINDYLDTGLYLDRAGAYGIQDPRCDFVKSYRGSYTNILGLPMEKLTRLLLTYGIDLKNNSQGGSDGRRS